MHVRECYSIFPRASYTAERKKKICQTHLEKKKFLLLVGHSCYYSNFFEKLPTERASLGDNNKRDFETLPYSWKEGKRDLHGYETGLNLASLAKALYNFQRYKTNFQKEYNLKCNSGTGILFCKPWCDLWPWHQLKESQCLDLCGLRRVAPRNSWLVISWTQRTSAQANLSISSTFHIVLCTSVYKLCH